MLFLKNVMAGTPEIQDLALAIYLHPRWFRLVFQGNPSNQGDGKTESGVLFGKSWQSPFTLPVGKLSFDLETSLKQLCYVCSLKGIADKTSFEGFRKEHDTENLF